MNNEVRRFIKSLNAKITIADEEFVRKYLNKQEQIMFYRQRLMDQRHALNTAYYILRDTAASNWVNKKIILKAALLHDVGKNYVFMPLWIRPVAVLLKQYLSGFYEFLAKKGSKPKASKFTKYFYAYEFHAEIGEKMLREIGVETEVLKIVANHHNPPAANEPKELPIFRRADSIA